MILVPLWLISCSTIISRYIHVAANGIISFFFMAICCILKQGRLWDNLSISPLPDYKGCFAHSRSFNSIAVKDDTKTKNFQMIQVSSRWTWVSIKFPVLLHFLSRKEYINISQNIVYFSKLELLTLKW